MTGRELVIMMKTGEGDGGGECLEWTGMQGQILFADQRADEERKNSLLVTRYCLLMAWCSHSLELKGG